MRAIFLCHSIHTHGTYFRWHNLAVGLTQLGHEVTVYAIDPDPTSAGRREIRDGVPYRIVHGSKGNGLFGHAHHPWTTLRRLGGRYPKVDILHAFQPFLTTSLPLYWRGRSIAKKVVYDWDDLWVGGLTPKIPGRSFPARWAGWWLQWAEGRLPAIADHVTVSSDFLKAEALKRGASGVTIVPNGVWPAALPDRASARATLGLQLDACYLGFMGFTLSDYEERFLFEPLIALADRHPNLRMAICGPEVRLRQAIPEAISRRVDYLGHLSAERTRLFARSLDLGLLPLADTPFNQSRFPIKFAEYLGAGTPVLCSSVGYCHKLAGHLPYVFSAGKTYREWCDAFEKGVAAGVDKRLPAVSLAEVYDLFSWQRIAGRLAATYDALLA